MDSETHDPIDLQTKELKYAFLFYFILFNCLIWGRDGIKVYLTNSIFLIVYQVYIIVQVNNPRKDS